MAGGQPHSFKLACLLSKVYDCQMLESVCSAFGKCLNNLSVSCFCEMSSTDLIRSLSSPYLFFFLDYKFLFATWCSDFLCQFVKALSVWGVCCLVISCPKCIYFESFTFWYPPLSCLFLISFMLPCNTCKHYLIQSERTGCIIVIYYALCTRLPPVVTAVICSCNHDCALAAKIMAVTH